MATYPIPEHQFSIDIPLNVSVEGLRRLLGIADAQPPRVIDLSELMNHCPCTLTKYFGFDPLNGNGYVVDSDQYIVHLDIADQRFWVTEK